jgi:hypothetical protein
MPFACCLTINLSKIRLPRGIRPVFQFVLFLGVNDVLCDSAAERFGRNSIKLSSNR